MTQKQTDRLVKLELENQRLRAALMGLVGVDTKQELEQMRIVIAPLPIPEADKKTTLNAIDALLETL